MEGSHSPDSELDELAGHGQLPLRRPGVPGRGDPQVSDIDHFVREQHCGKHEGALPRPERRQVLLGAEYEAPDAHLPGAFHGLGQQCVGASGGAVGYEVVTVLEEERVDLGQVDELLDLDAAAGLGRQAFELLGLHDDILAAADFVAFHDLGVIDLLPVEGADPLLVDPPPVGTVKLMEPDVLGRRRRDELDGDVHQTKTY